MNFMTNNHFIRYTQWKQASYFLIAGLLIALTITHASYYYKLLSIQQKVKAVSKEDPKQKNCGEQLLSIVQEIDKQELYALFNGLIETMPPSVKIEKIEYSKAVTTVTCRAQNNNGMMSMIEACAKNRALKKLSLKNSVQEKESILFILE